MKTNYFTHDYGARNDPKLIKLQMVMGALGLAIFWCIIEMLWENAGFYPCVYDMIAYNLQWAKEEDVRRVVEQFSLFEDDGNRFWSPSVLRRMEERKIISERNAISGRKGGKHSGESRRVKAASADGESGPEAPASEAVSADEATASDEGSSNEALASKGERIVKKDSKKSKEEKEIVVMPPSEEEKEHFYEIFFFKNFSNPNHELTRFLNYYNANGWTWGKGKEIRDRNAVAEQWTPENKDLRFDPRFLNWYKAVFLAAKQRCDNYMHFISDISTVKMKDNNAEVHFTSKETAQAVADFVDEFSLHCTFSVRWKVDL